MFKIGDMVWYRKPNCHSAFVPAVITGYRRRGFFATDILTCRCEGALFDSQGRLYQFESRACHICGAAVARPGNPLCPDCIGEQAELERDARAEKEQRRRPR